MIEPLNTCIINVPESRASEFGTALAQCDHVNWKGSIRATDAVSDVGLDVINIRLCEPKLAAECGGELDVVVVQDGKGRFWVRNVSSRSRITKKQHKLVLEKFASEIAEPLASRCGGAAEWVWSRGAVDHFAESELCELLRLAQAVHPEKSVPGDTDDAVWEEWVIRSHLKGARDDAVVIREWLTEVALVSDRVANGMAQDYESRRLFLSTYDRMRMES